MQCLVFQVLGVIEGRWFLFDDKTVTPWDAANMEEQCFGGFATEDPGEEEEECDSELASPVRLLPASPVCDERTNSRVHPP
jgi:hypothetical protein